jgi:hypothetical protein
MQMSGTDGQAKIENGEIVFRVAIENLPTILDGSWATGNLGVRYKITNAELFAADLLRELNHESEDGSTPIHALFDRCIDEAINQGAQGLEEHEDQAA